MPKSSIKLSLNCFLRKVCKKLLFTLKHALALADYT